MKKFATQLFSLFICIVFVLRTANAQTYLNLAGGFEGEDIQVINSQAYPTGGQSGKWTKANITQNIELQNAVVRSGQNALGISNSSNTTLRRVYTPTFSATPGQKLIMQYYRRVSSTSNTQESLAEIARNGSNTSTYTQPAPSVPVSANVWEKVVFSPDVVGTDFNSTTWAAIQHRKTGTGSDLFVDDVAIYPGTAVDNTPPNTVTGETITNNLANPATDLDLTWNAPAGGVDGGGYMVVRFNVNPNADNDPNVNGIYGQSSTFTNGTGGITGTVIYVGNETRIVNTGLSYGTQYWFKIYVYDKAFNYSSEAVVTASTLGKVYYSKAAGSLNSLSTWGMNPDGSGAQPTSFSENYQLFNVVNNPSPTITGNWTVSLQGSRVIVGNGSLPVNLTIPAAYPLSAIIDIKRLSTVTSANTEALFLSSLDPQSTVHYNATGDVEQNIAAAVYGNLILSGANTKLPAADFSVSGDLTITSSAVLQADGFIINVFGNWRVDGGGVYEHFNDIRSSINFRGSGSHTIFTESNKNFMNVKIFENGTVRLLSDVVIDSTLLLYDGKFVIGTHTLTLDGSFVGSTSNPLSGSKMSNLIAGPNYASGWFYFDQSADSANYLNSLVVNTTIDTLTLGNKLRIAPNTLNNGMSGMVKIGNGAVLEILDSLVLVSDATGTARIAKSSALGNYIAGNITVQRYVPAKKAWHLLTAPVISSDVTVNSAWMEDHTFPAIPASAEVGGYGTHITGGSNNYPDAASAQSVGFDYSSAQGADPSIRVFQNGNWNSTLPDGPSATLFPDYSAYLLYVRGDRKVNLNSTSAPASATVLRATGLVETGSLSPRPVSAPFTLLGNPYPSSLDFEKIYNATPGIQNRFWKWDYRLGTAGGHTLVQRTGANAYIVVPADLNTANADVQHIPSGYGFFLRPATSTVNLSFSENEKSDSLNTNTISRSPEANLYVSLYKTGTTDSIADGVLATFGNGQAGVDANDAPKPANFEENLALRRGGQSFMLEARPQIAANDTLFLSLTNKMERAYSFKMKADNFSGSTVSAFIIDSFLHTKTPINLSGNITTYNFTIGTSADSKKDDRFMIVFEYDAPLPVSLTSLNAYGKDNGIAVEWNVTNEGSIAQYEVEKSTNGVQFSRASAVAALNLATGKARYNWLDIYPVSGYNYYRIKTLSLNGETKYSNIVRVNLNNNGNKGLALFPNPVKGSIATLQLTNLNAGVYALSVFNQAGQKTFSKIVNHSGGTASQTIDLTNLPAGVYQLLLAGGDGSSTTLQFSKN